MLRLMRELPRQGILGLGVLGLQSGPASAHALSPGIGDFYVGAYQLIGGSLDIAVWVSVALLAARHRQELAGWGAELFASGLLAGFVLVRIRGSAMPPELLDAAILLCTGSLLALGRPLPSGALVALVCMIGALRGWQYGAETMIRQDLVALAGGLVLAGYTLVACMIGVASWFSQGTGGWAGTAGGKNGWRLIALRAVGSWMSAVAILIGGVALRRL